MSEWIERIRIAYINGEDAFEDFVLLANNYGAWHDIVHRSELYDKIVGARAESFREVTNTLDRVHLKPIDAISYATEMRSLMYNLISEILVKGYRDDDSMKANYKTALDLVESLDVEEFYENKTKKEVMINGRIYQPGIKVTKLLGKVDKEIASNYEKENGRIVRQKQDIQEITISSEPVAMFLGGEYGESCLSPDGENFHAVLFNAVTDNVFVAHNDDFTWRCLIYIDKEKGRFAMGTGYPNENFSNQFTAKRYFEGLGLKLMAANGIHSDAYVDGGSLFSYVDVGHMHLERMRIDDTCLYTGIKGNGNVCFSYCESCESIELGINDNQDYCDSCAEEYYVYCEGMQESVYYASLPCYYYNLGTEGRNILGSKDLPSALHVSFSESYERPDCDVCPLAHKVEDIIKAYYECEDHVDTETGEIVETDYDEEYTEEEEVEIEKRQKEIE